MNLHPELSISRSFVCRLALCHLLALSLLGSAISLADENPNGKKAVTEKTEVKESKPAKPKNPNFKAFSELTKNAQHISGMIDLYHEGHHLYAVLKPDDLDRPMLLPIGLAAGAGAAGTAYNIDEQWIIAFKRVGDQIQLVRKNFRYTTNPDSPLEKAVQRAYLDSNLNVLNILSDDAPAGGVVVDLKQIFFSNFANLSPGNFQLNRSTWRNIKGFEDNVELEVEVTFDGSPIAKGKGVNGDFGYIDSRGVTIVLHYSLVRMPDENYRPRRADPRIGHFVRALKNFDAPHDQSLFTRNITRWRLEKVDPTAEMSPPKKQIVFWIEDTVPPKYRPYVESGILEWNKAFEKIGYQNAISARWQNDNDKFDPEDVNYSVFRWITSPYGYAMSNMRTNPITGEILDGDIVFDASWTRYWRERRAYLVEGAGEEDTTQRVLGTGEIISPMMATQNGFGLSPRVRRSLLGQSYVGRHENVTLFPSDWNPVHHAITHGHQGSSHCNCHYSTTLHNQMRMAELSASALKHGSQEELPLEALGQIVKSVVMHEVGHSLGLKHNFLASGYLSHAELQDTAITKERGLVSSVMDYVPLNLALPGQQQGDYATTTLGPYDYWAIEYAYKEFDSEAEEEELKKIASRSAEPGLAYSSDEELYSANDPYVNQYDLGSDPLDYAKHRVALATLSLQGIEEDFIQEGESWIRLRSAVLTLLRQYGDAAYLATRFLGGRRVSQDVRGTAGGRDPIIPVEGDQQREALAFLQDKILIESPAPINAQVLRRLATEQWTHWGVNTNNFEGKVGLPYYEHIQAIHEIVFSQTLGSGKCLRLVESNEAMARPDENPLRLVEIFDALYESTWGNRKEMGKDVEIAPISKVRRNLQHLHIRYLSALAMSETKTSNPTNSFALFSGNAQPFPNEARSLARRDIKRIRKYVVFQLKQADKKTDPVTVAHLEEIQDQLKKLLTARPVAPKF